MGYTSAETSRTIQYACLVGSTLPVSTTATSAGTRFPLPEYSGSRKVPHAGQRNVLSGTGNSPKLRFILRGGFFSIGGARRRLFAAGHLHKHAAHPVPERFTDKNTVNQIAGISA